MIPSRTALSMLAFSSAVAFAQSADPATVSGTFLGDGKEARIAHLVVQTREPFSDQAAIRLVFTEKDPSKSEKPEFDAGFKRLGSALILSMHRDGGIFGCEVAHTAHEKSPFSALGQIKMEDFTVTDMTVSGRVTTGGELDAFGQKWNVDLAFSAPLPKGAFAEEAKPMTKEEPKEEPAKPAGPKLAVSKLPLPATAKDVEYKAVVGHITFRSDASVSEVAGEFSAKLKEQGWKDGTGSLMGKANVVLKRERDGASLTIMVQPAASGCDVKVFTEGLDWSDAPKAGAATSTTPTDPSGIEAEVQKRLQEALKGLPKF
jgi:hypothetical protein